MLTRLAQSRCLLSGTTQLWLGDYLLEHPEVKVSTGVVDALNAEHAQLEKKVKQ